MLIRRKYSTLLEIGAYKSYMEKFPNLCLFIYLVLLELANHNQIKCSHYYATIVLRPTTENPDDMTTLLTAPTGTAAINIEETTVHSALYVTKIFDCA